MCGGAESAAPQSRASIGQAASPRRFSAGSRNVRNRRFKYGIQILTRHFWDLNSRKRKNGGGPPRKSKTIILRNVDHRMAESAGLAPAPAVQLSATGALSQARGRRESAITVACGSWKQRRL